MPSKFDFKPEFRDEFSTGGSLDAPWVLPSGSHYSIDGYSYMGRPLAFAHASIRPGAQVGAHWDGETTVW